MKKVTIILFLIAFSGCDSEKAVDCFQSAGKLMTKEIVLPNFEEILILDRVKLYLTYGETQKVLVKTGANLLGEIKLSVEENSLILKNENTCNMVREYKSVEIYVTSPNLTSVRNGSQWIVESTNTLVYPNLTLLTEDFNGEGKSHTNGGFDLQLDCDTLKIVNNGYAVYFLSGKAKQLSVGFYAGDGRLEASELIVQELEVFHRSSNQMIVNPQASLRGEIRSTGDVISLNRPPVVEVEEFYTGKLVFETP